MNTERANKKYAAKVSHSTSISVSIIFCICCILSLFLVVTACTTQTSTSPTSVAQLQSNQSQKMTIAATFYPLYDMTRTIAGDAANVYSVVPLTAEPHEYDSSPQDLIRLDNANVFVTLGVQKGFAPYEERLIETVAKNITIIGAGDGIQQINPNGEFGDVSDDLDYSGLDPHIWLSPKNAIIMATNIRDGLIKADPKNAQVYEQNGDKYIADLKLLDAEYTVDLNVSNCSNHIILAAHDAYSYMARDYNFKSYYIDGLSPEQEPTPQQIARLIDVAKQYNLTYVMFEKTVDPKISNVIASQIGATTLAMSPFESQENANDTFISVMQANLQSVRTAMDCS